MSKKKVIIVESCGDCKYLVFDLENGLHCKLSNKLDKNKLKHNTIHPDCPLLDAEDLVSREEVVAFLHDLREKNLTNLKNEKPPVEYYYGRVTATESAINAIQSMPSVADNKNKGE